MKCEGFFSSSFSSPYPFQSLSSVQSSEMNESLGSTLFSEGIVADVPKETVQLWLSLHFSSCICWKEANSSLLKWNSNQSIAAGMREDENTTS